MPPIPRFAALVTVGPKPQEIDRVADLVASIAAFEHGPSYFVMVDDAKADRKLTEQIKFPINMSPVSLWHDRSTQKAGYTKGKGICSVILTGLQWIARYAEDAQFVLKLDSDALVIAPFANKIFVKLSENPAIGMIGAYTLTPNGTPRDISRNAAIIKNLHKPAIPWLKPRKAYRAIRDRATGGGALKDIRAALTTARKQGYAYGEHCLGGGYALSREFVRRMETQGHLKNPLQWLSVDSPEDVMIGMYTAAVGLKHANFVGDNEVFGVRHEGLPYEPAELVSRGYSVIHSIKNDKRISEREVRAYFAARRLSAASYRNEL